MKGPYLVRLRGLNELLCVEHLAQCQTQGERSINGTAADAVWTAVGMLTLGLPL